MEIDKIVVFAENGDKNLDGFNPLLGFPAEEKPERQWFNYLFNVHAVTTNQIIDDLSVLNFEFVDANQKINEIESNYKQADKAISDDIARMYNEQSLTNNDLISKIDNTTDGYQIADAQLQEQINSNGGGKLAYKTYDLMIADAANILANTAIDVTNDSDDTKNGAYTYDGSDFIKSNYDPQAIILSKVANAFETKALMEASPLPSASYAVVVNDQTPKNNGFYQKKLGSWILLANQSEPYILEALDPLSIENEATTDNLATFTDNDYNVLFEIDNNLNAVFDGVKTNRLETKDIDIIGETSNGESELKVDKFGNILSYYDSKGHFKYIGQNEGGSFLAPEEADPRIETDIIHVSIYGQSLSLGLGATTVSTASEAPNALVPNQGIEDGQQSSVKQGINALPLTSTSLVAFNPALNPNLKENPIYGTTIHLQKSLDARGSTSKILPSAHGYGATAIAGLSKGTINYNVGVAQSKRYREYASARGDSCLTQFMLWVQGEADISTGLSKDAYKTALNKLLNDYQTDINQSALKPIMLTYQVSSHTKRTPNSTPDIAYAQLECANENPYIKMACATYPMAYYDGVHMVANSYKWMGAYFGKVIDWMLENKRTDWKPLQPEKIIRTGKVITVIFHVPVKPLVLDTTMVTNPSNYGFTVKDSAGNNLSISSVTLKGDDRVNIVLSAIPTSDVTVTYALGTTGADAGYNTGARGNLRDSDNTISKTLDENGNPYSLYNWCVLFDKKEGFTWA